MAIPEAYIQELVARNDIFDTVQRSVSLKRSGRQYKGLCPFHSERSPSFTVYPETQSYYCFGCGAGGDVIRFTMDINNLTYIEAVRMLAQNCGMSMPDEDDGRSKLKSRILAMNKIAARFFHEKLNSDDGRMARKYLRDRKLSDKTIVNFGLGYGGSLDDRFALVNHLRAQGFSNDEIAAAYLGRKGKNGGCYDIFSGRVMFPIIDLRGNVIGFGGRRLTEDMVPKYLNSGDTPVFKKSNGLYALNFAKKSGKSTLILCEGYMDVIAMHQAGFTNAIATLGTALTQQQARLIGDYANKVVISYDSDEAGQKATRRAIEIFQNQDITVQVLQMEGAKDPDEYIKEFGADAFEMLIEGAASALDFSLIKLRKQHDLTVEEQKVQYISKACGILADLNNPIQHDVYAARLRNETRVDKSIILQQIQRISSQRRKQRNKKREQELISNGARQSIKVNYRRKGNTLPKVSAQQQIMCALLRDNSLYPLVSSSLTEDAFTDPDMKSAYSEFSKIIADGVQVSYSNLAYHLSDETSKAMAQAIARNSDVVITEVDVKMFISNLLDAKMTQTEASEKSLDEIARHLRSLRDKKK